jgi:hypothetical protein
VGEEEERQQDAVRVQPGDEVLDRPLKQNARFVKEKCDTGE